MRIRSYPSKVAGDQEVSRIKTRLREVAPMENWEFTVRKMKESDRYGAWVTYRGKLTLEEYKEREELRKIRSEKTRAGHAARKKRLEIEKIKQDIAKNSTRPSPR